jgi:hypothetical protein
LNPPVRLVQFGVGLRQSRGRRAEIHFEGRWLAALAGAPRSHRQRRAGVGYSLPLVRQVEEEGAVTAVDF